MTELTDHVCVCICTYKRPDLLKRLLKHLSEQETGGHFSYSVVVCDNDRQRSAEAIVSEFTTTSSIVVKYCVEEQQNICMARNKAIENAFGNFIAFIDDDEFPAPGWLTNLYQAAADDSVQGVLGPVVRHFDEQAPQWILKGNFFERPTHPTGFVIDWREGRTGNVLLKRRIFSSDEPVFDPQYHRGGDTDFFRRMTEKRHVFIWCNEAIVYEVVPPQRWTRSFMLKRALLRGTITLQSPTFGPRTLAKSVIAVPAYAIGLPFALFLGHHKFMELLVRLCDHLGKLMAFVGVKPVKSPFITD
jgi:glycosyltransferase involved in cell wall biosynthesis